MDIGTGIALVGVWVYPAACAVSKSVTAVGLTNSVNKATALTVLLTLASYLMHFIELVDVF